MMNGKLYLDEELFDKVEVDREDPKGDNEVKKKVRALKTIKAIKIALYALMGGAASRLFYKASNNKEKNTDYLDKY